MVSALGETDQREAAVGCRSVASGIEERVWRLLMFAAWLGVCLLCCEE